MNYLILDLSYVNFYRFYATKQWYRNAHPEETIEMGYDWSKNIVFMDKFKKMFLQHYKNYIKKFKIDKVIITRDCPRDDIWRVSLYPEYKGTRKINYTKNKFMGGHVFRWCYEHIIPTLLNKDAIQIKLDNLEADDLIYLSCKKIIDMEPSAHIYIISSDHDLLQIIDLSPNIKLYTANVKSYNDKYSGSADYECFKKAVIGDKSDNIPPIFKRCGIKTVKKLYDDPQLLSDRFTREKDNHPFESFCRNKVLVDFRNIPETYVNRYGCHIGPLVDNLILTNLTKSAPT